MKKLITSLLVASSAIIGHAQVTLNENFNSPFNLNAAGWVNLNNSVPQGTVTWFQGDPGQFPAYNGNASDYYAADYESQGTTSGGISNFLITPTVVLINGAQLTFATISAGNFPDRMQVLLSQGTGTGAIGSGTAAVGSFTTTLFDINPGLTATGYPGNWTVYTATISGITGTVAGRFAFRYFVDDGGFNGQNSDYIGLDAVKYTMPCGATVQNYTTCAGASNTISAIGGLAATSYSWSNGSTSSSIVVSPNVTTTYTLSTFASSVSCGSPQVTTLTIGSGLSVFVSASSTSVCSGTPVSLTASGASPNFTWAAGTTILGNGSVLTVTPGSTTTYSVGSLNGTCYGGNSITINVAATPTLTANITPTALCVGLASITINALGASTYTFLGGSTNPVTLGAPTATGGYFFNLSGTGANGCVAFTQINFTMNPTPTVTASKNKVTVCANQTVIFTASGANSYVWSGAATSTANPFTYTAPATAGTSQFTVTGTDLSGCTATTAISIPVSLCTGLNDVTENSLVTVYPNPFVNQLTVSDVNGKIEVFNTLGQLVISKNLAGTQILNTSDLAKGAYVLKAYSPEGRLEKTIKLMKD